MSTGSFSGVKCGRGVLLTTHPFQCRGHGRVELYLYPPSGPHRACNGNTLPYIYIYIYIYMKMSTGSFSGVKCGRGVLLTTHPLLVMEEQSYTSTHTLGHAGPVTGTLYLLYIYVICGKRLQIRQYCNTFVSAFSFGWLHQKCLGARSFVTVACLENAKCVHFSWITCRRELPLYTVTQVLR